MTWAKSKTMWFSVAIAVLGLVETQYGSVRNLVPEEYQGLVLVLIGGIVAGLRIVTTQPLSEK